MRAAAVRRASLPALVAMAALAVVMSSPPVAAHTSLETADPPPGQTVTDVVERITLSYGEDLRTDGRHAIGLIDPEGNTVVEDTVEGGGATIALAVPGLAVTGEYRVRWQITAADGDRQDGAYLFTYEGPVTPAATTGAQQQTPGPSWPFVAATAAAVTLGVVVIGRRRART